MKKYLPLTKIILNAGTQIRQALSEKTIEEYSKRILAGDKFPPVIVFQDKKKIYLADGFHRFHAHRKGERGVILTDLKKGTLKDAILYAVEANSTHGLKRKNADKRRAVLTLLNDPEWKEWSDREIARRCKVDHKTVGNLREKLTGEIPSEKRTFQTKHGTTAEMNVSNIGKIKKKVSSQKIVLSLNTQKRLENYSLKRGVDRNRVVEEAIKMYLGGKTPKKGISK